MNNFSERIRKCFSVGYSQSLAIQDIVDKLLGLTTVEVKLVNETDNQAEYSVSKISGPKILDIVFSTDADGSMTVTEIDDEGFPSPSINAVGGNFEELLTKVKEIINNRISK